MYVCVYIYIYIYICAPEDNWDEPRHAQHPATAQPVSPTQRGADYCTAMI